MNHVLVCLAAASLAAVQPALAQPVPPRPAADVALDTQRKPAEVLDFAGVKRGDRVLDFVMGGGFFTRALADRVGRQGRVLAYQPAEFVAYRAAYGAEQDETVAALPNATALRAPFKALALAPKSLDAIVTVQNYHDLHLAPFAADTADVVNARLFAALKPGGTLVVVDHVAATGSGLRDADTLHRIDPAAARAELERAGFVFEAESDMLLRPADPLTANVFDDAIRGRTSQFAHRYRRPR